MTPCVHIEGHPDPRGWTGFRIIHGGGAGSGARLPDTEVAGHAERSDPRFEPILGGDLHDVREGPGRPHVRWCDPAVLEQARESVKTCASEIDEFTIRRTFFPHGSVGFVEQSKEIKKYDT